MNLLVDVGNTRLKWALESDGALSAGGAVAHAGQAFGAALDAAWRALPPVDRVIVASVVDAQREAELGRIVAACCGRDAEFPRSPSAALGIRNAYAEPARLGIDRFLGLAAVHARRHAAQVLVSVGTAMTVDLLDRNGVHQGGLIVASPRLMREALLAGTARIGVADGAWRALPVDTADAVMSGSLAAAVGAIEGFRAQGRRRLGVRPSLVLAGGAADEIAPLLAGAERVHDLVLHGLALWIAAMAPLRR